MIYVLSAVIVLGVLIFVHELGHFLAARAVGIYVIRFSFGLGPKTPLAVKLGETEYCLSWVPFGGYVKMAGAEDDTPGQLEGEREDAHVPPERTFDHQPLAARIFVISAGVLMNVVFAVIVYTVLAWHYGVARDTTVTVGEVHAGQLPLGATGLGALAPGDRILRINGDSMTGWSDVTRALMTAERTPLRIDVAGRAQPLFADVPLGDQDDRQAIVAALVPAHPPVIGEVIAGDPAARGGLRQGDRVLRAAGDTVTSWEEFVTVIQAHPAAPLPLVVQRDSATMSLTVTPRAEAHAATAPSRTIGWIGVAPYRRVTRFGLVGSVREGFAETEDAAGLVVFTLKNLVLGRLSPKDIGGPILIGEASGEAAKLGIGAFLDFMALFSVNLAVLNLLPVPVLDGGHLLFLFIEGVRRRPLSVELRQRWMTVGLVLILMLMALALYNDVMRLVR